MKKIFQKITQEIKDKYYFWFVIEKNEFDKSLDFDIDEYAKLKNEEEKLQFQYDLMKRRNRAHELDLEG